MGCPRWCACRLDERQWQSIKAALGMRKRAGRPGRDVATSWKRSCGGGVQARRGESFPATLAPGRPCSTGSTVGQARVSGSVCSKHFVKTPTMSGTASTARSIALISTQPRACHARARRGHAPQTQAYRPTNTADGNLRTVGHGHVYARPQHSGTRLTPRRRPPRRPSPSPTPK